MTSLPKCTYGPSCPNIGTCTRVHSINIDCLNGANCPYRDKCVYVHPEPKQKKITEAELIESLQIENENLRMAYYDTIAFSKYLIYQLNLLQYANYQREQLNNYNDSDDDSNKL